MPSRFKHVGLIGKYQSRGGWPVLDEIAQFLLRRGLEVSIEKDTAANTNVSDFEVLSLQEVGRRCDLAVVVGGDGTMLAAARELARHNVPLIGINQGRLGFITDIPVNEACQALGPMIEGDYEEERRSMLKGVVMRPGANGLEPIYDGFALNEVVVNRGATSSMIELRVKVQNQLVANLRADGLIVASPNGSTAYALSAGGPILHPSIAGWVMVPIAPHTLSNRPIVLPDDGEVSIEIVSGKDAGVNFDMHSLASLIHGDQIVVRRSEQRARFLHPHGWSYYATLRRKLGWQEGVA